MSMFDYFVNFVDKGNLFVISLILVGTLSGLKFYDFIHSPEMNHKRFNNGVSFILTFKEILKFYGANKHTVRIYKDRTYYIVGKDRENNSFELRDTEIYIKYKDIGLDFEDYKQYITWLPLEIEEVIKQQKIKSKEEMQIKIKKEVEERNV